MKDNNKRRGPNLIRGRRGDPLPEYKDPFTLLARVQQWLCPWVKSGIRVRGPEMRPFPWSDKGNFSDTGQSGTVGHVA
jgi:hypothetical protein